MQTVSLVTAMVLGAIIVVHFFLGRKGRNCHAATIRVSALVTALTGFVSVVQAQAPLSFEYPGGCWILSKFNKMLRSLLRSMGALLLVIALLSLPRLALAQDAAGFDVVANFNSSNNPEASNTF